MHAYTNDPLRDYNFDFMTAEAETRLAADINAASMEMLTRDGGEVARERNARLRRVIGDRQRLNDEIARALRSE